MTKHAITFHNKTDIKTQAQIYSGDRLIATYSTPAGESCEMEALELEYDIYFRDGTTGREIARQLDNQLNRLTLSKEKDRWYVISEE